MRKEARGWEGVWLQGLGGSIIRTVSYSGISMAGDVLWEAPVCMCTCMLGQGSLMGLELQGDPG